MSFGRVEDWYIADHEDFNRCILELMCDQTRRRSGKVGCGYITSHYRWGDVMDRFLRAVLT